MIMKNKWKGVVNFISFQKKKTKNMVIINYNKKTK